MGRRPGGVEQRTEKIEDRSLAPLSAKLSSAGDVLEERMITRREKKCEMMIAQKNGGLFWREIDPHSQRFQHIRTAGLRGDRAISMFGNGNSRGCGNQRDGRGDVERVQPISAGAADIEDFTSPSLGIERERDTFFAQLARERCDFFGRLAFGCKCNQELSFE